MLVPLFAKLLRKKPKYAKEGSIYDRGSAVHNYSRSDSSTSCMGMDTCVHDSVTITMESISLKTLQKQGVMAPGDYCLMSMLLQCIAPMWRDMLRRLLLQGLTFEFLEIV